MRGARTFTTYMNIEPGKGNERALSRFEQQAQDSLRRVANTARQAGAISTGIMPGGSAGTVQNLAAAERARATALQRTAVAQRQVDAATRRATTGMILESNAARAAARDTSRLERSLRLASVAANVAQGPLGPIAGRLSAMATAVRSLMPLQLGLVGAGAGIAGFVRMASTAQDLVARLRPLYESQAQVNAAFAQTQEIANRARVGLEPVIDLYSRLTLAGRDVGLSQQRIARVTEIASKAAKLSGGTAVSQEAGLYQFAQGIGSGGLQGDELRSVRENTLRLAKAIADGLGVPIAELKKLGKEGKLTADVVAEALEKSSARIDAELAKLPPTISSATTKMSNAFIDLITKTDQATGVAGAFANVIMLVADNLTFIVKALGAVALAYAGFRTGSIISDTQQRISAFAAERREMLRTANEAKATSGAQRRASAERIVALRQERAALQQQIVAEQALANEKRRNALAINSRITRGDGFITGNPNDVAAYRRAVDEARVAQDNLAASKNRLRNISGSLRGEFGVLSTATGRFRQASIAATSAATAMGRSLRGLIAAINPLGLALAFAIPLLIEFAFRQDAAAGASDRMAAAQNRLAAVVDATTGRLLTQNAALIQNAALSAKEDYNTANRARLEARKNLGFGGKSDIFTNVSAIDPRIRRLRDQVRDEGLGAPAAAERLASLTGLNAASRSARDQLIRQLGDITTLAQEAVQARAQQRVLGGDTSPETLRAAFGGAGGIHNQPLGAPGGGESDQNKADGRKKVAKATDELAKAERELERVERRTDKRTDILSRYDQQSRAMDRAARDARELNQLVGETMNGLEAITVDNPLGKGIYTQAMADADRARIEYGVRQPIRDAIDEQARGLEMSQLRLEGYTYEVDALETALNLQDQIGEVSAQELETLIANARQQELINDALASRERQVGQILGLAQETRDAFEDMLLGLSKDPLKAIKGFGKNVLDNFARIQARQLTEKLFAGADEKLRELVRGSSGVDRAADVLASNVRKAAESTTPLISANDNLATATEHAADRINAAADRIGSGGSSIAGLTPSTSLDRAKESINKAADVAKGAARIVSAHGSTAARVAALATAGVAGIGAINRATSSSTSSGSTYDPVTNEIVVQNSPRRAGRATGGAGPEGPIPSGAQAYNKVFERLGESLDKTFKSGTFFSGIGKGVGKALTGAAEGSLASGLLGMTGLKQSKTGAAIGGAIGSFLPIPGGSFIGGAIGGTIGGLFKKAKRGSAIITGGGISGFYGNSSANKDAAGSLGGTVNEQIAQIAEMLGASVNSGVGKVSVGLRDGKWVVDPQGRGYTKTSKFGDLKSFGEDEQGAIAAAVADLIKDGVITGISQAAQNILRSGQDLQKAIEKAVAIESIPKRLMERTDPVRFAVEQLNAEFTTLISYLKEGGASAAQYADAQKLYELERADAIERATNQASAALQAYMDEMTGGAGSPFNKRTTYDNAASKLNSFRADINAGKAVNEGDLLAAARNFQDASRNLNGSSQGFFSDFDDIFALLGRARDNVNTGAGGALPGSPFEDNQVAAILAQLNGTTQSQTDTLAGKLDQLIDVIGGNNVVPLNPGSSVGMLPGFSDIGLQMGRGYKLHGGF